MISMCFDTFDVFYPFLALCSPLLLAHSVKAFRPETGPVHPFSVTPDRVAVSRYSIPISGIRRLLLRNGPHLYIDVSGSIAGGPLFLNYMSMLYKAVRKWAKKVGPVSYAELTNVS